MIRQRRAERTNTLPPVPPMFKMLLWLLTLWCPVVLAGKTEVLYGWSLPDFAFPNNSRDDYIASEKFIPKHNIILDSDIWEGPPRKVFVTLPKMKKTGVPATLATVTTNQSDGTPLLQPYPDWSWHNATCEGIMSVYRIFVDTCDRLWVLETGNGELTCPQGIFLFDLNTDQLIKRHVFSPAAVDSHSHLLTIVVDTRDGDCAHSVAYVTDAGSLKLVVYDLAEDRDWRFSSDLFHTEPEHHKLTINGVTVDMPYGVFGLALGPVLPNKDRILYFHSLAMVHENWVSTSVLRNSSAAGGSSDAFHQFPDPRQGQSAAMAMTDSGVLFYTLAQENAIGCWNSQLPYSKQHLDIAAKNDITMQFQSGMKVHGDTILSTSSRYQNFKRDRVPEDEVNYFINIGNISELVQDTKCMTAGFSGNVKSHSTRTPV